MSITCIVSPMRRPKEEPFFTRPDTAPKVPDPELDRPFRIRSKSTLTLVARVLLSCHLDYEAAVDTLFPRDKIERRRQTQDYLEGNADLTAEIEEQLKIPGLDETSKEAYVRELWMWMWGRDNELKTTAARLLGKALIPEKSDDKPAPLPLKGMDEGLARMLGTAASGIEPAPDKIEEVN